VTSGPYQERRTPSGRFLPPDPRVREPHRLTPQLALRVAVLGVVALAAFGVLVAVRVLHWGRALDARGLA